MKSVSVRVNLVCVSTIAIWLGFPRVSDAKIESATVVGIWLFDEGQGNSVKDSSGNGHNGEIGNGINWKLSCQCTSA